MYKAKPMAKESDWCEESNRCTGETKGGIRTTRRGDTNPSHGPRSAPGHRPLSVVIADSGHRLGDTTDSGHRPRSATSHRPRSTTTAVGDNRFALSEEKALWCYLLRRVQLLVLG